jgi:plasmid stabilization system protein ParE
MAQVIYARAAFADLDRIYEQLEPEDPTLAANTIASIATGARELAAHPGLGRNAEDGLRERALSRGRTGYVLLYRHLELDDVVLVLAIRHRFEAGYPDPAG